MVKYISKDDRRIKDGVTFELEGLGTQYPHSFPHKEGTWGFRPLAGPWLRSMAESPWSAESVCRIIQYCESMLLFLGTESTVSVKIPKQPVSH